MALFDKLTARWKDTWCKACKCEMAETWRRLYALPDLSVGHYEEYDAGYYRQELRLVDYKDEIPAGMYACGAILYCCPKCGRRLTKLDPFLPVRDKEKHEPLIAFKNGELDDILWDSYIEG